MAGALRVGDELDESSRHLERPGDVLFPFDRFSDVEENGLTGTRNAPTVVNSAYFSSQFWDGRAADLVRDPSEDLFR